MEQKERHLNFIVVTGPESTGKTQLAEELSRHFKCRWVPELSRHYIEQLGRSYTYEDVEAIARQQIEQFTQAAQVEDGLVIYDTGLIITKVWFDVVYEKCPPWLLKAIHKLPKALHLLCDTDLPWEPDAVRENGGAMRIKLFELYQAELIHYKFPFEIISGQGNQRLMHALEQLKKHGIR